MTFACHHFVSLAILRPVIVDVEAGIGNLATRSVKFESPEQCIHLFHRTLPTFEKTPQSLGVMSTTWKAAPHTDNCNFSVRGSHLERKDVNLQVTSSFVFPSSPQGRPLLVISPKESSRRLFNQEGRITVNVCPGHMIQYLAL